MCRGRRRDDRHVDDHLPVVPGLGYLDENPEINDLFHRLMALEGRSFLLVTFFKGSEPNGNGAEAFE